MTSFYDSYDYYKKMLELQEKLRKSEEERIRLEERFKILVQESRNRHDACINRLRLRYIEFLEEQRTRDERNHKLLEALDRVDNSLASMTAKTDRLNVLRKRYEAYLRHIYTVPTPSGSIIGDNNIANQCEDKHLKRDVTAVQINLYPEIEGSSSPQILRSNAQTNRSISPSALKLNKSMENMYYDHCERNAGHLRTSNQQINDNHNILGSHPLISQSSELIQQLPQLAQNLSWQDVQQRQPYAQIDENFHIQGLPLGQLSCSSKQPIRHFNFNKSFSERMETVQPVSHFVVPGCINGSISQYKFLDVPQNRFTPMTLQHTVHSSSAFQPYRPENNKILLDDTRINVDEISPICRTVPAITQRNVYNTSSLNKSFNLSQRASPTYLNYSWKKPDYFKSKQKFVSDTRVRSVTTSDIDNMIRRHKRFTPKTLNNGRLATDTRRQASVENDEYRTATIVENELDRYIDKIRKLHSDLDAQSLEEVNQERSMSDDIVNVSLSDKGLDLPIKDRLKENLSKEVGKVLALADDLVSRTVDLNVASDFGKHRVDEDRNLEIVQTTQSGTPTILERNHVAFSHTHTQDEPETSAMLAKDKIGNDMKLDVPKLDSHKNIERLGKKKLNNQSNTLGQCEWQLPKTQGDEHVEFGVSSNDEITEQDDTENLERAEYNEKNNIYIAPDSNVDQYSFDIVEELEPWNLDILQKRIKEIDLNGETEEQVDEKGLLTDPSKFDHDNMDQAESINRIKTIESREDKQDSEKDINMKSTDSDILKEELKQKNTEPLEQQREGSKDTNETEISDTVTLRHEKVEYEDKNHMNDQRGIPNIESAGDQADKQNELGNKQNRECDETNFVSDTNQNNEQELTILGDEYNDQHYYDNSHQEQNYPQNYETEYVGLNDQYNYDQNASYENNQDQNYDQNMSYEMNQEEDYDPNASYATNRDQNYDQNPASENNENQECQEYINEKYVQESNEGYGEYVDEQYVSENQYGENSNVQYQEESNEQYAYTYDQQYDPNQVSDTHINQHFAHTDYDFNHSQFIPEDDKQNQEYNELQEESNHEKVVVEEKVDTVRSKNERLSFENGSKKKKDVIKSLLDSDTDSTIERNVSNTESDFDFN